MGKSKVVHIVQTTPAQHNCSAQSRYLCCDRLLPQNDIIFTNHKFQKGLQKREKDEKILRLLYIEMSVLMEDNRQHRHQHKLSSINIRRNLEKYQRDELCKDQRTEDENYKEYNGTYKERLRMEKA